MPTKFADPVTMRMWRALDRRGLVKAEALAAWLAEEYDVDISAGLIRRYKSGTAHTPAGLLPLLVEYTARRDLVFGPYEREIGAYEPAKVVSVDEMGAALDRVQAKHDAAQAELDAARALLEPTVTGMKPIREAG